MRKLKGEQIIHTAQGLAAQGAGLAFALSSRYFRYG